MNFDYIQDVKPETDELAALFTSMYQKLGAAEECYWGEPLKCGRYLLHATEDICKIYNAFYQIGFSETDSLTGYLCYTNEDSHNVMVSRFLSVARSEQRDRLEWLRVWGDECISLAEHPESIEAGSDKPYLNAKKMMIYMLDATREMCERIYHIEGLGGLGFQEQLLPGYAPSKEQEEITKKKERFSFWKKQK